MTAEGTPTDTIAQALHRITDGIDGSGTTGWPPRHREVYALAVDEVADALANPEHHPAVADALVAADSQAVLDALTRAGVLTEDHRVLDDGMAGMSTDSNGHAWFHSKPNTVQRRLVTKWREVES